MSPYALLKNKGANGKERSHRWKIIERKRFVLNCCASTALSTTLLFTMTGTSWAADAVAANALPTNPVTEVGNATYSYTSNSHDVNLGSAYVKTQYDSYNIGRDATVKVKGTGTFVSRVKDTGGVSHIYGALNAPDANVFILNSSGVTFHGSSQVNVGSLVASTAKDVNFDGEIYEFSDFGNGSVANHGNIKVSNGGFAILAAPNVENTGTIIANLGKIELASTTAMTVDLRGDGLIGYVVTNESLEKLGVKNTGTLQAQSGTIAISANIVSDITQSVINMDGIVDADAFGIDQDGGKVIIRSTGDINLNNVAISVDGGVNGDGGEILTWADGTNTLTGESTLSARGGEEAGDGGFIDFSGNNINIKYNNNIDATAPNGESGSAA
jgi:filamentous hemagglutinin family protein